MKNPPAVLGKIASSALVRVAQAKKILSPEQAREQALMSASAKSAAPLPFKNAIAAPGLSFICEVKKASPSRGVIAEDFPWLEIAKEYEAGGAAAISVLTEPDYFMGSDEYLRAIAKETRIPVLRKDFIIDVYQLYEAKIWGAKAVLLICALLEPETISAFIAAADELALDCLVEIHSEAEAEEAVTAGARIIGINNRDLVTFDVDTALTSRLCGQIPQGILTVAESGIRSADDIREIKACGADGVLIGESLMRSNDRKKLLRELISA